jgi:dihydrofolate reductase
MLTTMHQRSLSMILAVARTGALGWRGKLPWSYPEDREHFEQTTHGHVVIMGRKTWEEEGRALPGRTNVVVSRSFIAPPGHDVLVARTLDEALETAWANDPETFVIGGAQIFAEALPRVTRIYLTEIPTSPEADVYFTLDRSDFRVVAERHGEHGLKFVTLERVRVLS